MANYVWLTIVATLGSWAILVPSKFVEGKLEDQVPMRITLMLLGALLGLIAWGVAEGLMIRHDQLARADRCRQRSVQSPNARLGQQLERLSIRPLQSTSPTSLSCSYLPRWWRQTEYTRSTRMSLVDCHQLRLRRLAAPHLLVVPATDGNDRSRRHRARDATGKPLDATQPAPGNQ